MSSLPSSFFNPQSPRGRLVFSLAGMFTIYALMYFVNANYLLNTFAEIQELNVKDPFSAAALLPLVGGLAVAIGPFAMKKFNLNFGFIKKKAEQARVIKNDEQQVTAAPAPTFATPSPMTSPSGKGTTVGQTQGKTQSLTASIAATGAVQQNSGEGRRNDVHVAAASAATAVIPVTNKETVSAGVSTISLGSAADDNNAIVNNNGSNTDPQQLQDSERILEEVENKLKPAVEEVGVIKQDVVTLKEDMSTIRTSMESLSSTLETSLVDLKAFQAEMVNPINFMRKYFDTMDIKALSDPSAPLNSVQKSVPAQQQEKPQGNATIEPRKQEIIINENGNGNGSGNGRHNDRDFEQIEADDADADYDDTDNDEDNVNGNKNNTERTRHPLLQHYPKKDNAKRVKDILASRRPLQSKQTGLISRSPMSHDDASAIRTMLETGITPGKIMSIVSVVDEILTTMGPDGVDLLVEQYKRLGLTEEDELVIYTILRLLNESKIYTEEIIAMLYRFGQVLGINDRDAELQYTRLIANKNRRRPQRKQEGEE